jgi:DNA-binding LacI/PurR family transcriptional regulator
LGFVGSGDLNLPGLATVSLTLILQPAYELGRVSTRLLLRRIKDPTTPVEQVIVPAEMAIRASSKRGP